MYSEVDWDSVFTVLEQFDAAQTRSLSEPLEDVDTEGVHAHSVDEEELFVIHGRRLQTAKGLASHFATADDMGDVQDPVERQSGESEASRAAVRHRGLIDADLGGIEPEVELGRPRGGAARLHEPFVARARLSVRVAEDVPRVAKGRVGNGVDGRDVGGEQIDDVIGVSVCRRGVVADVAQSGELSGEDEASARGANDGVDGSVEAGKRQVGPTVSPDDGVGRISARERASDVGQARVRVVVYGRDLPVQARYRGDLGRGRVEERNASGRLLTAQAGEVPAHHDVAVVGGVLEGGHGEDVRVGHEDVCEGAVGQAHDDALIPRRVGQPPRLLLPLVHGQAIEVAGEGDTAELGQVEVERRRVGPGDGTRGRGQEQGGCKESVGYPYRLCRRQGRQRGEPHPAGDAAGARAGAAAAAARRGCVQIHGGGDGGEGGWRD